MTTLATKVVAPGFAQSGASGSSPEASISDIIDTSLRTPTAKVERAKIDFCEQLLKIMEEHKIPKSRVALMLGIDHKTLRRLFR